MEEICHPIRKILRKGRASLDFELRFSTIFDAIQSETACYRHYTQYLEKWAMTDLLPKLDEAIEREPRRRRIYTHRPKLQWSCDGVPVGERWLSVTVTLTGTQMEAPIVCKDYRVWDLQKGTLCPIEWFLPRRDAARYCRWAFRLDEQTVYGIPKSERRRGELTPTAAGKIKYLFPPS